ncbi:MAG: hypothetical protein MJK14_16145 [Rivularia sp. ALOHA_DT_140]|nr:hypothetical protein [Rivularia sp. ALOHA_DT_140]
MKNRLKKFFPISSVLTAVSCIAANPVLAEEQQLTAVTQLSEKENPMAQITPLLSLL